MTVDAALDARIRFADAVQAATDREFTHVSAGARKSGRSSVYPYVPVLRYATGGKRGSGRVEQIRGLAYASRTDAVKTAETVLFNQRVAFTRQLCEPRYRALRESRGLPREVPS